MNAHLQSLKPGVVPWWPPSPVTQRPAMASGHRPWSAEGCACELACSAFQQPAPSLGTVSWRVCQAIFQSTRATWPAHKDTHARPRPPLSLSSDNGGGHEVALAVVLICVSLMADASQHHSKCALVICFSSWVKRPLAASGACPFVSVPAKRP